MRVGRLEAFSDGVLAIIITIMVLELKVPHGNDLASLRPMYPVLISYILSFINIGIYWNNHHHMLSAAEHVNGKVMWANMHLLFWLSLVPFATEWMGETHFTLWPIVIYGFILAMSGVAYYLVSLALIQLHGVNSTLAKAIGKDNKGVGSVVAYITGIGLSFIHPLIGLGVYMLVAAVWFIPDKRIEKELEHEQKEKN